MSARGRLAIHGHFYQPERRDPFSGRLPDDPSAAPFANWNARITAECYRPNAERGNLDRIGFDAGPTLTGWLADEEPSTLARIVEADGGVNAIAQAYHHVILPLASARDRTTEIRWGLADFQHRFGRPASGFWLPETAADLGTLRALAGEGIRYTILAPWQAAAGTEFRRPYRIDLGGDRAIAVMLYDSALSGAVSFHPDTTADADRFADDLVRPALAPPLARGGPRHESSAPLVLVATDGELYGHHQRWRDLFLARLLDPDEDRGFDVVTLGRALADVAIADLAPVRLVERTSWSCHHGVLRWSAECPCVADGRWKAPLRAALERLAGAVDAVTERVAAELPGRGPDDARRPLDPWAARDAFVEVVLGRMRPAAFASAWLVPQAAAVDRSRLLAIMEAQRWRLAMFGSDGWYWDDPVRQETRQVLRCAGRAARIVDGIAGTSVETALVADLGLFTSPSRGIDGAAIYRLALGDVGQPARVEGPSRGVGHDRVERPANSERRSASSDRRSTGDRRGSVLPAVAHAQPATEVEAQARLGPAAHARPAAEVPTIPQARPAGAAPAAEAVAAAQAQPAGVPPAPEVVAAAQAQPAGAPPVGGTGPAGSGAVPSRAPSRSRAASSTP